MFDLSFIGLLVSNFEHKICELKKD